MQIRNDFLPFSRPSIGEDAIESVAESIRCGWVAMGPKVVQFEKTISEYVGSKYAISMNSATAGLHSSVMAMGIGPGDDVITTPMTFASTVNAIILAGARPVLVDIDRHSLNIDVNKIEQAVTPRTKAIIPVHFAGLPCDMDVIEEIAGRHNLMIIEDAAHALGTSYKGRETGSDKGKGHVAVFSFHPTKNITTAEGGIVCTEDEEIAEYLSVFRQNGMSKGAWNRYSSSGNTHYDVPVPGLKYQMSDIQAAIGLSQIKQLDDFNRRRREICTIYETELSGCPGISFQQSTGYEHVHSRHIFPILVNTDVFGIDRDTFMLQMKERNVGTAIHYNAIHLFSGYAKALGMKRGDLPEAEYVSDRILSIPLFPAMADDDVAYCIEAIREISKFNLR